jgi:stage II sporulation protein D
LNRAPAARPGALLLAVALAALLWSFGCAPLAPVHEEPHAEARPAERPEEPAPEVARAWEEAVQAAPLVRVGLAGDAEEVGVTADGPFVVTVYADSVSVRRCDGGVGWRFEAAGRGLSGRSPDGGFDVPAGTVRIAPAGAAFLVVDGTAYRGEVEIFLSSAGLLSVVNVIDLESYLRGVVPLEIGPRPMAELEAVKAQAIAARTYALAAGGKRAGGDYDMHATVADQVYGGVAAEHETSDRAVLETAGLALTYRGEPIVAYFHANCGGRTEARHEVWEMEEVPYLVSALDTPGGGSDLSRAYCRDGSGFTWRVEWSGAELDRLVREHLSETASTPVGEVPGRLRDLRVAKRGPSGRVRWLEVETDAGVWRVFGDRCRWLLRRDDDRILRSAWFDLDVERRGGRVVRVVAEGRGYGHGVGMCQHGALGRARQGFGYADILAHYYRGARVSRVY